MHVKALAAGKGKRGKNRAEAILTVVARALGGTYQASWGDYNGPHEDLWYDFVGSQGKVVQTSGARDGLLVKKILKPKKSDYKQLPLTRDCTIDLPDASITLNNKTKTVTWDVPENNHARAHARGHYVAKALFRALDRVDWKRGSGGQIVGNDEYNRDNYESGGGGNYTIATYPPPKQPKNASLLHSYSRW